MKLMSATTAALLLAAAAPAWSQHKPHVHGVVNIDIAVQGNTLTVQVEAPLDNLVGFEHRPRTAPQLKAAEAALKALNDSAALFKPAAAAQCDAGKAEVDGSTLQPAVPGAKDAAHADLDATYTFTCAQPAALSTLELGLFDAFRRIQRIDVQVAGPQGQRKQVLRRPARQVQLLR